MRSTVLTILPFLLVFALCGCAKKTLVALVPDPDGHVGSISVTGETGTVSVVKPYQATTVQRKEAPSKPEGVEKQRLDAVFADALAATPPLPLNFFLYFKGDATLSAASVPVVPQIMAAIRQRNSSFISVIGHTDTMGEGAYNLDLARQRAVLVKEMLVGNGIDERTIFVRWYGKRALLVPTGDEVWEPRNRAVEVVVR